MYLFFGSVRYLIFDFPLLGQITPDASSIGRGGHQMYYWYSVKRAKYWKRFENLNFNFSAFCSSEFSLVVCVGHRPDGGTVPVGGWDASGQLHVVHWTTKRDFGAGKETCVCACARMRRRTRASLLAPKPSACPVCVPRGVVHDRPIRPRDSSRGPANVRRRQLELFKEKMAKSWKI